MKQWDYWDGQIIKGAGRQISFVLQPLGPGARTQRLVWIASRSRCQRQSHRALRGQRPLLADERRRTRPQCHRADIARWPLRHRHQRNTAGHGLCFQIAGRPVGGTGKITVAGNPRWRASNEIIMLRPDGNYEMFGRAGVVMISTNGVLARMWRKGRAFIRASPECRSTTGRSRRPGDLVQRRFVSRHRQQLERTQGVSSDFHGRH